MKGQHRPGHTLRQGFLDAPAGLALGDARGGQLLEKISKPDLGVRVSRQQEHAEQRNDARRAGETRRRP